MPFSSQWFSNPSTDDYTIDNSCSFDATNDYLYKTLGTASNRKVFTISCWVKRSKLDSGGTNQGILSAGTSGNDRGGLFFVGDEIHFSFSYGGTWYELKSSAKYRDTSGWMHIVVRVNTDTGTAADRTKIYVNGSEIAYATSGYVPEDAELPINDAVEQVIGAYSANKAANDMFGGYIAEMYFIDNGALTPSSFGETSSTTGQWIPKDYTGSYGDNGYRLSFGTSGAMGDDTSGEENDFSLTGISANNQFTDSPTKNFPTWDPQSMQANISLSEANLIATNTSNTQGLCFSTLAAKTGKKYYAEFTATTSNNVMVGVVKTTSNVTRDNTLTFDNLAANDAQLLDIGSGDVYNSDTTPTVSNYAPNDSVPVTLMVALDLENDKIYWGDAGVGASGWSDGSGSYDQAFSSASGVDLTANLDWFFTTKPYAGSCQANLGQDSFTVDPPTGYVKLNTANFDDPAIADPTGYFHPQIYTGNGSTQTITLNGTSTFAPALTIIKNRTEDDSWVWTDDVRGATKIISSDTDGDEDTDADTLTAFTSNGFSLGDDEKVNFKLDASTAGEKYVSYSWKANEEGAADADGMTKTSDSSTTSITVSADATAGFSIIKYTGNGSASTLAHGLGKTPSLIITKDLGNSRAWPVYHSGLSAATKVIYMNTYSPEATDATVYGAAPTSSVVNIATSNESNGNTINYIQYVFAEIDGFSKFGTYIGNGADDGPFINLGFKPAIFAVKARALNAQWYHWDAARNAYNPLTLLFCFDLDADEAEFAGWSMAWPVDFLSNGVKLRDDATDMNTDGQVYLYAAWASSPVKYATAR